MAPCGSDIQPSVEYLTFIYISTKTQDKNRNQRKMFFNKDKDDFLLQLQSRAKRVETLEFLFLSVLDLFLMSVSTNLHGIEESR